MFNLVLSNGKIPPALKKSVICPVLKKGDASNIENYRPITLHSNFAKVLESDIIQQNLCVHKIYYLISAAWLHEESINFNKFVMHYTRHFRDTWWYFSKKMRLYEFSDLLLSLFGSYLIDRQQCVRYHNSLFETFVPTSGVPQGSNLEHCCSCYLSTIYQSIYRVINCCSQTTYNCIIRYPQ